MTENTNVSTQIHAYHALANDLQNEHIKLQPFVVEYLKYEVQKGADVSQRPINTIFFT